MNNLYAFLPMLDSSDLRSDPVALRERFADDGYLLLRDVVPRDKVLSMRAEFAEIMRSAGWLSPYVAPEQAVADMIPVREGDDGFFEVYDRVQRLESFHALAHSPEVTRVMRDVVGPTAFPHPLKIARLIFPDHHEVSTPPHQDYLNNMGTVNLTAVWIPLGDCPRQQGSLAILRGSHHHGVQPLSFHLGPGNRQAELPTEMLEELRWVTTDMRAGDVLVFGSLTVHASLHNSTNAMRLSVDYRFQPEGEALTAGCLEPHFGRLGWDEVYAGWESDEHQYYWRQLDYEVVDLDRSDREIGELSRQQLAEVMQYRHRMDRMARRPRRAPRAGATPDD